VIVGFATSSPEMFVSVDAAFHGFADIAVGNVIGSNIANILLVLGAGAVISALACKGKAIRRDTAMMAVATICLASACMLGGYTRVAGGIMVAVLIAYIVWTFIDVKRTGADDSELDELGVLSSGPLWRAILVGVFGLVALLIGADMMVNAAVALAQGLGVSDRVIAVSMVAVGTSLPELATVIIAARRGHADMAVGNVLGSCVFNVFGVLGISALAAPLLIAPGDYTTDIAVATFAGAGLLAMILFAGLVNRFAGILMLGSYFAYIAWLYLEGAAL
jgi:cation:H+ antiporter